MILDWLPDWGKVFFFGYRKKKVDFLLGFQGAVEKLKASNKCYDIGANLQILVIYLQK